MRWSTACASALNGTIDRCRANCWRTSAVPACARRVIPPRSSLFGEPEGEAVAARLPGARYCVRPSVSRTG